MRTTWPVLTSAIVIGALAAALTSAAPRLADVEPLMARFLADSNVVGVSVGVEHGSDVIVRGGWGLADRRTGRKATAETVYRLGSSSKQFTAALVMRLVERGVVGLDDPVDRHLPQMPRKWLGITIRQLLNRPARVRRRVGHDLRAQELCQTSRCGQIAYGRSTPIDSARAVASGHSASRAAGRTVCGRRTSVQRCGHPSRDEHHAPA